MYRIAFALLMSIFIFQPGMPNAAGLSADDFLPPVQANTPEAKQAVEQIAQPQAVKEEKGLDDKPAISAATAQDAVNAAVQRLASSAGCEEIKFPSGFGFVATGVGTYGVMPNPTATLVAQRHAYQVAFLNAKKNLTEALHGLSSTAQEQLKQEFKTIISDTDTLSNVSEGFTESIREQVNGLLRGYVVYNVNDEQNDKTGTVTVTIVATPKTMGKTTRVDASSVSADSVKDGLSGVLAELSSGLLPPVGGKVISVPQTGELAFIGFGSAVVPENPNPATQAKLALNAQKVAQMRARSALCGIILGDRIEASSSLDSSTRSLSNQFEEAQKDDPTANATDPASVNKLQEQRNSFVNTQFSTEQIASLRSGIVPPGVNVKTFMNPEKTMAEAVAVYLPSVTARATKAGEEMKKSQIVQDPSQTGRNTAPGSMPSRGPSGQVTKDADL